MPEVAARRPRRRDDRPAAQPDPRPARRAAGRRCPATSTRPADFEAAEERAGRPRAARRRRTGSRRTSSGPSATSWPTKLCGADADTCDQPRARRPAGHDHARRQPPEDRREVGQGGGDRAAREEPDAPAAKALGLQEARAVDGEPAQQGPPQRRARRRSTTRPASSSPTSAARTTTRRRPSPSSSRSTTSSARATASPVRRSSRSTT